jgi:hypothetical protein
MTINGTNTMFHDAAPAGAPARASFGFRTFSDLAELPEEPEWLWRGFLAPGSLTMLSGFPFAGKTMIVGALLRAMDNGEAFLGYTTRRATAVVVSEEDDATLRARAQTLGLLDLGSEYLSRNHGALSDDWPALVSATTEHALAHGHSLLVFDTFPGLAGLDDEQENDAGAITKRLRPLQDAAGRGVAVVFTHHMNNAKRPRGSKAFSGVVDTSIRFLRTKNTTFKLETESRFASTTPALVRGKLVMTTEPWSYVAIGSPADEPVELGSHESTDERLAAALLAAGPAGVTYDELDTIDGLSADIAKKRLPKWRMEDKVGRHGEGTKTDPFRWYVPVPVPDSVPCGVPYRE